MIDFEDEIKNNLNFIKLLCTSKKSIQKELIKNATSEQIYAICDIILNILKGKLKLDDNLVRNFYKKRKAFRELASERVSLKKRKSVIQKGGFLEILIPSIVAGLASVVSSIIDKI